MQVKITEEERNEVEKKLIERFSVMFNSVSLSQLRSEKEILNEKIRELIVDF